MSKALGNIALGFKDILIAGVKPIADAFGEWVVNGGKLGDMLKQILKQMLSSIVSLIVEALIFEGILALMNLIVPNSGTAFATGIAVAGGALTQGQGIDMSGFNSDTNNAKSSFMTGFMQAMGGSATGFFGMGGGFFDKGGYYDLAGRQKALPTFDTGGYITSGSSRGFPAWLHPNEVVIPMAIFNGMTRALSSGSRSTSNYSNSRSYSTSVNVHIYSPDLNDPVQVEGVARKVGDAIERRMRRMAS